MTSCLTGQCRLLADHGPWGESTKKPGGKKHVSVVGAWKSEPRLGKVAGQWKSLHRFNYAERETIVSMTFVRPVFVQVVDTNGVVQILNTQQIVKLYQPVGESNWRVVVNFGDPFMLGESEAGKLIEYLQVHETN